MAETTDSAGSGDDGTREAPAKKTTARKSAPRKSAPRKSAAKKSAPKKSTAAKAAPRPESDGASARRRTPRGAQAALLGAEQLVELTGKEFEGIVGIAKGEDGWTVEVEVLEMRRIPSTTDVLAAYEVSLDREGDLVGYRRLDRYVRGSAREERS